MESGDDEWHRCIQDCEQVKGISTAWTRGMVLAAAIETTGAVDRFGKLGPEERVPLDLARDAYVLGLEHEHGFPFVVGEELIATIHDFDAARDFKFAADDRLVVFAGLSCTRSALASAAAYFADDFAGDDIQLLERLGTMLGLEKP